jgi:hypothetical protein
MADAPTVDHPTEYDRTPLYERPLSGIVRVMERLLKSGMAQRDAVKES